MKIFFKIFFKMVRIVGGPIVLLNEWLTTKKALIRTIADQQRVDDATRSLTLFHFKTCPFCMKVRRASNELGLKIEKRDAQHDEHARQELLKATGAVKVPCLKISTPDGTVTWMHESDKIIGYLQERFAKT